MRKLVFLTGAGISAESGIPTFRGAIDGLWENHNVEEVATAKAIKEHPEVVYRFLNELRDKYKDCQPNSAHKAIAGVLYYTIETKDKTIMFPINMNNKDDVGTTTFEAEYKPITLMRYIRKAIENNELIIINK